MVGPPYPLHFFFWIRTIPLFLLHQIFVPPQNFLPFSTLLFSSTTIRLCRLKKAGREAQTAFSSQQPFYSPDTPVSGSFGARPWPQELAHRPVSQSVCSDPDHRPIEWQGKGCNMTDTRPPRSFGFVVAVAPRGRDAVIPPTDAECK